MSFSSAFIQINGSQYFHLDSRYTLLVANRTWLNFSFNAKNKNKIYFYYWVNDERVVDTMFHGLPMKNVETEREKTRKKRAKRNFNACAPVIQVNSRIIELKNLIDCVVHKVTKALKPDSNIIIWMRALLIEFVFVCQKRKEYLCLHLSHHTEYWIICLGNI